MNKKEFYRNEAVSFFNQENKLTQGRFIRMKKNKCVIKAYEPMGEYVEVIPDKVYKDGEPIIL